MFDKDKEYGLRLDQEFLPARKTEGAWSEDFAVFGADVPEGRTIDTPLGAAQVATFEVAHLHSPDQRFEVNTIAQAIVSKAREATDDDFPAVVRLGWAKSSKGSNLALVMQFVRPWK